MSKLLQLPVFSSFLPSVQVRPVRVNIHGYLTSCTGATCTWRLEEGGKG